MIKLDVVETWLSAVGYSHSNSKQTSTMYKSNLQKFLDFIEETPEQILEEYENSTDRRFKRKYAQCVKALISSMQRHGYSPSTVNAVVNTIRSFFKYSDLPLGFIPTGSNLIEFHNKDIAREEILEILKVANVRDRAFFCMMAQSGLRPSTIANLKIKDVERILDENTPTPCGITVRQENTKGKFQGYFSFVGKESVEHAKDYLKTRPSKLTANDYLFTKLGHNDKPISPSVMTHIFRRIVLKLRKKGLIEFETSTKEMQVETRDHKPLRSSVSRQEIRLYNLRKFFRKYAGMSGADYTNFWMGHTSALGVDLHYFSRDVEHHRQVYCEKAMPHLRLETATPSETDKIVAKQTEVTEELQRELHEAQQRIQQLERFSATVEFSEMKERMKESLLELIKEGKLTFGEGVKVKIDGKEVRET